MPNTLHAILRSVLFRAVASAEVRHIPLTEAVVRVDVDGHVLELRVKKRQVHDLRPIESRILNKATKKPAPTKVLARKSGYKYGPHFRHAVANLVRLGLLLRRPEGVCLPD